MLFGLQYTIQLNEGRYESAVDVHFKIGLVKFVQQKQLKKDRQLAPGFLVDKWSISIFLHLASQKGDYTFT